MTDLALSVCAGYKLLTYESREIDLDQKIGPQVAFPVTAPIATTQSYGTTAAAQYEIESAAPKRGAPKVQGKASSRADRERTRRPAGCRSCKRHNRPRPRRPQQRRNMLADARDG